MRGAPGPELVLHKRCPLNSFSGGPSRCDNVHPGSNVICPDRAQDYPSPSLPTPLVSQTPSLPTPLASQTRHSSARQEGSASAGTPAHLHAHDPPEQDAWIQVHCLHARGGVSSEKPHAYLLRVACCSVCMAACRAAVHLAKVDVFLVFYTYRFLLCAGIMCDSRPKPFRP